MAKSPNYETMKMADLRAEIATRGIIDDRGLPIKSREKIVLISALKKYDKYRPGMLNTLLSNAVERIGNIDKVERLIKEGANVNAVDINKETPLMLAHDPEIVETLIRAGADVDYMSGYGWSALIKTAKSGYKRKVKKLLEMGANIDLANHKGETALMWAAKKDRRKVVETLIKAGANSDIQDNNGKTARDYWQGPKREFDLIVERFGHGRMVKVARSSPKRLVRSKSSLSPR